MSGALMELVAYGAQDVYLTGNPKITHFKKVYRRYTNFATESMRQTLCGTVGFGQRASSLITRNGDLLSGLMIEIVLPSSGLSNRWVCDVGHHIISEVSIEIGGQIIDRHYSDWLEIWAQLTVPAGQKIGYREMIGQSPRSSSGMSGGLQTAAGASITGNILHIPLQFWFCRNIGLSLPLIALQYHEVKINIDFAKSEMLLISEWKAIPNADFIDALCVVQYDNYIYYINNDALYSASFINGVLGAPLFLLNIAMFSTLCIDDSGYLYIISGLEIIDFAGHAGPTGNVYSAQVENGNVITAWEQQTNPIPYFKDGFVQVYRNHIYVTGGTLLGNTANTNTYVSEISTGGTLSSWTPYSTLHANGAVIYDGYLYIVGAGTITSFSINNDGSVGDTISSFVAPYNELFAFGITVYDNTLYIVGGMNDNFADGIVYTATLAHGVVTKWGTISSIPAPLVLTTTFLSNNVIYSIGGSNNYYVLSANSTPNGEIKAELWADYVFLDIDERKRFAQVTHEYLIEQLQFTGDDSINSVTKSFNLLFNHPIKELIWICKTGLTAKNGVEPSNHNLDNIDTKNSDNFTTRTVAKSESYIKSVGLYFNGASRFERRQGSYFNLIQTQCHTNIPDSKGIFVYSFSLKPEDHQPSGSCNFSRLDNISLNIEFQQGSQGQIKIYAVNYNVLRIMSGMAGVAYSN